MGYIECAVAYSNLRLCGITEIAPGTDPTAGYLLFTKTGGAYMCAVFSMICEVDMRYVVCKYTQKVRYY